MVTGHSPQLCYCQVTDALGSARGRYATGRNVKARAITRISFREMAMQRYWFVVVSCVLLLAALGFALDVGIVAMTLRSEAD